MIRTFAFTAALLVPVAAFAQDLPTAPYLPLDMATQAAQAAVEAALKAGADYADARINRLSQENYVFKNGALEAAEARVEQARIELGYTRISAPIAGRISITAARVGELPTETNAGGGLVQALKPRSLVRNA